MNCDYCVGNTAAIQWQRQWYMGTNQKRTFLWTFGKFFPKPILKRNWILGRMRWIWTTRVWGRQWSQCGGKSLSLMAVFSPHYSTWLCLRHQRWVVPFSPPSYRPLLNHHIVPILPFLQFFCSSHLITQLQTLNTYHLHFFWKPSLPWNPTTVQYILAHLC